MRRFSFALRAAVLVVGVMAFTHGHGRPADLDPQAEDQIEPEVIGGTITTARPEIGKYYSGITGCTGTLIHPRFVLTATHCNYGFPVLVAGFEEPRENEFKIGGESFPIDRVWAIGAEGPLYAPAEPATSCIQSAQFSKDAAGGKYNVDAMLVRLSSPVPSSVATPARIADLGPREDDWVSTWGYGRYGQVECGPWDGNKRYVNWRFKGTTTNTCPGDSGGPAFLGQHDANGPIWGVTSFSNVRGPAALIKENLFEAMREMGRPERRWVEGTDRPGADYRTNTHIPSVEACERHCVDDTRCRAWSYESTSRTCSLKSRAVTWIPRENFTSGLRPIYEVGVDRRGSDYHRFDVPQKALTVGPAICAGACGRDSRCRAYAFANRTCWLKNSVPPAIASAHVTSGVKLDLEVRVDRPGGDYHDFASSSSSDCARRCGREARCRSYTLASGRCYLKEYTPFPVALSNAASGTKRPLDLHGKRLEGPSVPGKREIALATSHPAACRALCNAESSCIAFTFRRPLTGLQPHCTLFKNPIESAADDWTYTSGFAGTTFF